MAASDGAGDFKLSDVYDKIWSIYEELENSSDSSSADKYQNLVARGITETEKAVHIVNELSLFSKNEHIDEVASNDIRYIILPGLLGYFVSRNQKIDRFDAVCKGQAYFIDFIRLCKMYELTDCDLPQPHAPTTGDSEQHLAQSRSKSVVRDLEEQTKKRQRKIEQLKRRRELEQTLKELTSYVKQEHADDENVRQFYLTLVNKWLADAFDNLDSFEAELPILEHMARMKANGQQGSLEKNEVTDRPAPLRPFIITKNELQKKVFGIGYPSIPTVTVDEFYDQRVSQGLFPSAEHSHHHPPAPPPANSAAAEAERDERDAAAQESNAEHDDEESLRRQRNWDDWKDDHRRGWGNTQNKG